MADTLPAIYRPAQLPEIPFEQKERMAETFAQSGLFGVKTKQQALALILIGEAEGMPPALAVQEFDIIEGKPSRKAERIQARFQLCGGKITWKSYTNDCVEAHFEHPQGSPVTVKWTIEDAKRVTFYKRDRDGNGGKWYSLAEKHTWKSFPRAMLRSRVISEGARTCYPAYAVVTLCTDEALDMGQIESDAIVDDVVLTAEESAGEARTSHAAKKDGDGEWADAALNSCQTEAELDELLTSSRWKKLPKGWKKTYGDKIEVLRERVKGQQAAPSAFEALKQAGLECLQLDLPEQKQEMFEVWAGCLTPEKLEACTEEERAELRTLYKNLKAEIAG